MPDALFHYALLAHMRSSCIRRLLKKSIFPTNPSIIAVGVPLRAYLVCTVFGTVCV